MALPTGTIKMSDVLNELGKTSGSTITLNDSDVRSLAGKTSGTISMNDLKGKSGVFTADLTVGFASVDTGLGRFESFGYLKGGASTSGYGNLNPKILENGAEVTALGFAAFAGILNTSIISNYPSSYTVTIEGKEFIFPFFMVESGFLQYMITEPEQHSVIYNILKANENKTIKITIK